MAAHFWRVWRAAPAPRQRQNVTARHSASHGDPAIGDRAIDLCMFNHPISLRSRQ